MKPALRHRIARGFSRSKRTGLAVSCHEVSRKLHAISRDTERDFLAVGQRLEELVVHARTAAQTIGELLSERGIENGNEFSRALDAVLSWAESSRTAGCVRREALEELATEVLAARAPLKELRAASRMLGVTAVITRIESARLGDHATGFVALGDEVARLAVNIEQKCGSVLTGVEGLHRLIISTGTRVLTAEQQQSRDLRTLVDTCRAGLASLQSEQERFCAASLEAQRGYESILAGAGRMVSALQFHDSARQRLEHIEEALTGLAAGLESGDAENFGGLLELQSAQLEETQRAFSDSMARIRRDLQAMQATCADLVAKTRGLLPDHTSTADERGFSADTGFRAVAIAMQQWNDARSSVMSATTEVGEGCARIAAFVGDIRDVGMRLLRLALNAEVEAVRLADSGAVMEAVASGIRSVTQQASAHAQRAGDALLRAEEAVAALARDLNGVRSADDGAASETSGRVKRLGAELERRSAETCGLLVSIVKDGEALDARMSELRAGITADRAMDDAAHFCLHSLEKMSSSLSSSRTFAKGREFGRAAGSYTMQREREVHALVTGSKLPIPRNATGVATTEWGANVELF